MLGWVFFLAVLHQIMVMDAVQSGEGETWNGGNFFLRGWHLASLRPTPPEAEPIEVKLAYEADGYYGVCFSLTTAGNRPLWTLG